jgi:hypothetical protein
MITFSEFMAAADLTPQKTKTLRRRGQLALAWGRSDVYASLLYFEIDTLAHALNQALASIFKRDLAASLVRCQFDIWGDAAARADASKEPIYFGVVEFTRPGEPRIRSHLCLASDTDEPRALARLASATPQARGYVPVRAVGANMTGLLAQVRADALKANLDFSNPFLPPPDHPAFAELFAPYVAVRDQAVAQVHALTPRGRERLAQQTGDVARKIAETILGQHGGEIVN